ncbi:MAG: GNAT family N-acetyltransferase [Flavobacteriales bacterium]|nr:GNAT family N-acetyltransferase [Flavobacteriales bacterium]
MELLRIPAIGSFDQSPKSLDPTVMSWVDGNQAFYRAVGFSPPWIAYLALEEGAVVGTCAFKGAPTEGVVEIAYATHPGMEGRGIATGMTHQLIRVARSTDPTVRIIAQTLPVYNASTRVLTKCGFAHVRNAMDDEVGKVWEWELAV